MTSGISHSPVAYWGRDAKLIVRAETTGDSGSDRRKPAGGRAQHRSFIGNNDRRRQIELPRGRTFAWQITWQFCDVIPARLSQKKPQVKSESGANGVRVEARATQDRGLQSQGAKRDRGDRPPEWPDFRDAEAS